MPATLEVDVLTLFPATLNGFCQESILGRAQQHDHLAVRSRNLRDWASDKWQITDDRPFGGGAGMVLKPEPLAAALDALATPQSIRIFLSPDGEPLTTPLAQAFARSRHLILVSGHYEGIDERIRTTRIDREVSIGDYVLTNGSLAAAVLIDAVARHLPGVLGEPASLQQDSFADGLLGVPQYTRPAEFEGHKVPDILLSGNHEAIRAWRQNQRETRTRARRPDLLQHPTLFAS